MTTTALTGKHILISGSASEHCPHGKLDLAHRFVHAFTRTLLESEARIVVLASKEPLSHSGLPIVFSWTALRALKELDDERGHVPDSGHWVVAVTASKFLDSEVIPEANRALLNELVRRNLAHLEILPGDLYTGGLITDRQATLSDGMIAISGGKGVRVQAEKLAEKCAPVLPMDINLGSSHEDGSGAIGLRQDILDGAGERFFRFTYPTVVQRLSSVSLTTTTLSVSEVASSAVILLGNEFVTADKRKDLAIILKGGGVKGLAHVGALQILSQYYEFTWFVGTSAGALVAVLMAAGYSPGELEQLLRTTNLLRLISLNPIRMLRNLISEHALFDGHEIEVWINSLLNDKLDHYGPVTLADLPKRVTVYATQSGKGVIAFDSRSPSTQSSVDAWFAVRCSISIPYIFAAPFIQGARVFDGGLRHNFPADRWTRDHPNLPFVAVYLGGRHYLRRRRRTVAADVRDVLLDGEDLQFLATHRECTVVIDPSPIGTLNFMLTEREKVFLLNTGRLAAMEHLQRTNYNSPELAANLEALDSGLARERNELAAARARRHRIFLGLIIIIFLWFIYVTVR